MTKEIFTPENKSIETIFSGENASYAMPIYQRPYAWDKERVEQLWFDILEAYQDQENNPNYFLGSVVVVENANVKSGKRYDVVDGQQRLTTLTILFRVLQDLSESNQIVLSSGLKQAIDSCLINSRNAQKRLILSTHINNQADFEHTLFNGDINYSNKNANRFLQTAQIFRDLILKSHNENDSEKYIEDFSDFLDYLFDKVTIIRIVCSNENFAIKLFSILNDRGMDLTPIDIIKAHMLQSLQEEDRDKFIEVWKVLENTCKNNDEEIQDVFQLYIHYLIERNTSKSLQEELKEQFDKSRKAGKDSIKTLLEFSDFLNNLITVTTEEDKHIYMLRYVPYTTYWRMILTTAKQVKYKQYNELKTLIMRYFYQNWIAGGTVNRIKQTSFNILRDVKNHKDIQDVKMRILNNLNAYDNYQEYLMRDDVYQYKWHKPVLVALEYEMNDDSHPWIALNSQLQTEHILPIGWYREELDWKQSFTDQKQTDEQLVNCLGNLTLLSSSKNISASNGNYSDKIEVYEGKKKDDGITSYEITKAVISTYPQKWTAETIKERRQTMIGKLSKIFNII